jgi:Uncharacterised protein family (UPF0164).
MLLISFCFAQETAQSKIRIGVLKLVVTGADDNFASTINSDMVQIVSDMGFYKVYSQGDLENSYAQIKEKFPAHCMDPRCVIEIGSSLGLDRMIYGSIDKNSATFGVRLFLVDVPSKQTVERVNLEGEPGVGASDLLKVAVTKLHGLQTANTTKMRDYFGPEVHNEKQFLYSSGICIGLGLIFAAINGGLQDFNLSRQFDTLSMSGKVSSTLQVPFFGRPAALADQYVAASDDAYGVLYNPAGMAWLPHSDVALGYQYRFNLINNFVASYVNKATREIGFGECVLYSGDYTHLQDELYFISSYAYKFNQHFLFFRPFSIGASVKLGSITSPKSDDATASQKTFVAGLDVGLLTEFADNIRFGLVFKDLPTIEKVNNTTTGTKYLEYEPTVLQLGGTYRAGYSTFLICQGQVPLYADQPWKFSGGIEQEIFSFFKARLGVEKQAYFDTPWLFTAGFGLDMKTESMFGKYITLDGAYEYNTLDEFPVANMSFRFGF